MLPAAPERAVCGRRAAESYLILEEPYNELQPTLGAARCAGTFLQQHLGSPRTVEKLNMHTLAIETKTLTRPGLRNFVRCANLVVPIFSLWLEAAYHARTSHA